MKAVIVALLVFFFWWKPPDSARRVVHVHRYTEKRPLLFLQSRHTHTHIRSGPGGG